MNEVADELADVTHELCPLPFDLGYDEDHTEVMDDSPEVEAAVDDFV